jgi:hypothetical protein
MAELLRPQFRVGDRVRYVGAPGGAGDEGARLLLSPGLVGHVIEGPEGGPGPSGGREAPCYRVLFGGTAVWVVSGELDWE